MAARFDYIHEPNAISQQSFHLLESACDFSTFPGLMAAVARRVVHASALPEAAAQLAYSEGAAEAGREALLAGAPVLVDAEMVARGITQYFLPARNEVQCFLDAPGVAEAATARGETRSSVAVERWAEHLSGSVCVIGNAPTALFRLLEMLAEDGAPRPALIIGFAVGFVGAAESKAALEMHAGAVPFITIKGRLGGSAMAAAAVNAIAITTDKASTL